MTDKKVTVWLRCKQVVHYDQQVELTQEEYDLLSNINDSTVSKHHNTEEYNIIQDNIDNQNVLDTDWEFTDVELYNENVRSTYKESTKSNTE